jgi:TolA-binding protein
MSRKSSAPSVSFFAFQDIITSVVGIFVLITLIMVVQLAVKATDRLSSKSPVADNLSSIVALMQSEVDELKKRETELETVSSSVAGVQQFNIEEIRMDLEKEVKQLEERTKRFEAMH